LLGFGGVGDDVGLEGLDGIKGILDGLRLRRVELDTARRRRQPHPFNRDAILPAGWMLTTPSGSVQFNTPQAQAIKDPLDAIETFKAHIISHTPKPQEKPQ
ncbi:MAG: hypothetical protein AAFV53_32440, partial [Myxococcota bacterium]